MKVRSLLLSAVCLLATGMLTASCSDDENEEWKDEGSKITLPEARAYILNQGTSQDGTPLNDANLSFYAPYGNAPFIKDIFKKQNERHLGANGQCMIEHNDYIYVALSGSNCLVKLNEACVEQEAAYFASDEELSAGIRYLAAKGGYIYASFYGGVVAKINANTLKVEKKLKIKNGYNLEGIAVCGDNLYVANSYKIDVEGNFIYLEDVFVVELSSFEQKETLKVASNPNLMLEEEGKIFLISRGNYSDVLEQLQMIEPGNGNKITNLGAVASYMTAEDGVLYLAKSVADWSGYPNVAYVNTYSTYDVRTGKLEALPLVESADEVGKCSLGMIAVEDGDIYIGSPEDYRNNGTVYRIKKNGGLVEKFDCGGANPVEMLFFD